MGKLLKTGKKMKYKGCDCDVYEGPRGGRYVEWKGGMVSVPRRSSIDKKEVGEIINGGIREVFGVCASKGLYDMTVGHLTNALLLLFEFRTRFEDVQKPAQDKCTCSLNYRPRIPSKQIMGKQGIQNPVTQYDIICEFCNFLLHSLDATVMTVPKNKAFYINAVDEYLYTFTRLPTESECPRMLKDAIKDRLCSWHPMHDYIVRNVMKIGPPGDVSMPLVEGRVAPEFARLSSRQPKRYTIARMPVMPSALTAELSMEAARSLQPSARLRVRTSRRS